MKDTSPDEIDKVITSYYAVFDNRNGRIPDFSSMENIFYPGALITKRTENKIEVMTISEFMLPRAELLTGGVLTEFNEWETVKETIIDNGIASRLSKYEKKGILNGKQFTGKGTKHFQLLFNGGWKIISLLWEDDII